MKNIVTTLYNAFQASDREVISVSVPLSLQSQCVPEGLSAVQMRNWWLVSPRLDIFTRTGAAVTAGSAPAEYAVQGGLDHLSQSVIKDRSTITQRDRERGIT